MLELGELPVWLDQCSEPPTMKVKRFQHLVKSRSRHSFLSLCSSSRTFKSLSRLALQSSVAGLHFDC